jgi:hypothetical protein
MSARRRRIDPRKARFVLTEKLLESNCGHVGEVDELIARVTFTTAC